MWLWRPWVQIPSLAPPYPLPTRVGRAISKCSAGREVANAVGFETAIARAVPGGRSKLRWRGHAGLGAARILVTGASSGIGRALAERLEGQADLLLTGRNTAALAAACGGRTEGVERIVADLANPADRDRLAALVRARRVDGLVNAAGLGTLGAFIENPVEGERACVAVNVEALVGLTRALLPDMIDAARHRGGRALLINVASAFAFVPVPQFAVYGASKAFVLSFTEALASELDDQPIDVMALCPGPTRSDFGTRAGFAMASLPGALPPERVADAAIRAIGRQTVVFTDPATRTALKPITRARALVARAIDVGIHLARRR
ncbi:MAG: SDR family NAD(P)-dependent oxidoreductase [Geminicoccaceae bacterium]|nr:MAG: SDR family NAD(P)-dependent oxidoreductase [Geminicoccaceae bacterium]